MTLDNDKFNFVFDFDGVVANSNGLKTDAFEYVLDYYDLPYSNELISYHQKFGGITAKQKFDYYKEEIYQDCKIDSYILESKFREFVSNKLLEVEYNKIIHYFQIYHDRFKFHIISGGNKNEIIRYLEHNNIRKNFNGIILGNPTAKAENFKIYSNTFNVKNSCYFGDSFIDAKLSKEFNMKFLFISNWSDVDISDEGLHAFTVYPCIEKALSRYHVIPR